MLCCVVLIDIHDSPGMSESACMDQLSRVSPSFVDLFMEMQHFCFAQDFTVNCRVVLVVCCG